MGINMNGKSKSPAALDLQPTDGCNQDYLDLTLSKGVDQTILDSHVQRCRSLYEDRLRQSNVEIMAAMDRADINEVDRILEVIRDCKEALALFRANG